MHAISPTVVLSQIHYLGRGGAPAVGFVVWDGDDTRYFNEDADRITRPCRYLVAEEIGAYRREVVDDPEAFRALLYAVRVEPVRGGGLPACFYN